MKSYTARILLALFILYILQVFPYTGLFIMFAMAVAGQYIWGLLPHLLTVGLLIDTHQKRFPRKILLLPIFIYASYYLFYIYEFEVTKNFENELKAENSKNRPIYDSTKHALVISQSANAWASRYKVPVVYEKNTNFPQGYLAYRQFSETLCSRVKSLGKENFFVTSSQWSRRESIHEKSYSKECVARYPETPEKPIISLIETKDEVQFAGLTFLQTTTTGLAENEKIGTVRTAFRGRLSAFPFYSFGCALNSGRAKWECFSGFVRQRNFLNASQSGASPIAELLGLEKYEKNEKNFIDFAENIALVEKWMNAKKESTPEDLDEWGLEKAGSYQPELGTKNGVKSFKGFIFHGNKGGPFYQFIKDNAGKIIYLDVDAKPNARRSGFTNYGVCKQGYPCNIRTDNSYQIVDANGKQYSFEEEGKFKGFFKVGEEVLFETKHNAGDKDTITKLEFIPLENAPIGTQ